MSASPPTTEIEIISQAAILCGRQGFNTIDGGGSFARDGQTLYNTLVSAELGSNRWRFAQETQEISTLTTLTPEFDGWLYYWDLPADCLMFLTLKPEVDFLVFGEKILTKTDRNLVAMYCKAVPVSKWPPAFSMYIVYALAEMLAISVTQSDRMQARIAADKQLWQSRALFADGQNSPAARVKDTPYITVRYKRGSGRWY